MCWNDCFLCCLSPQSGAIFVSSFGLTAGLLGSVCLPFLPYSHTCPEFQTIFLYMLLLFVSHGLALFGSIICCRFVISVAILLETVAFFMWLLLTVPSLFTQNMFPDHCLGLRCGETHWFVPRVWSPLEPWNEDVPEGLIAGPGPWDVDAESKHYRALNPVTYHRMGDPADISNSHERDMHIMRDPEDYSNSHERDMHSMRDTADNSNFHERDMHSPEHYSNSHERDMSFLSNFEKTMNTSVDLNDIQALPDHALLAHINYEQNKSSPRKTADLELYLKSAINRDIRSRNALFGNDQWNQNGICQNKTSPQWTIFQNETSPLRKVPPGLQDEISLQSEQRNLFRNRSYGTAQKQNMPNNTIPSFSSVDSDEKMYRTNQNSLKRLKRASEHEDGKHYIPIRTLGSLTVDSIIPMREATSKLLATLYGTAFLCDLTTLLMYWNNLSPEDDLK